MSEWVIDEITYEGFPLLLRRPAKVDIEGLRPLYPIRVAVTHIFTKRKPNGLPEASYNNGLFAMDNELTDAFSAGHHGECVLVETFGGERNYYYYISGEADAPAILTGISNRYPAEQLSWKVRTDSGWTFLTRYAAEFF